jgi:hypothetical protein
VLPFSSVSSSVRPEGITSYLKIIFWSILVVGPFFQVLDRLQYACGFKFGSALILKQNLYFETGYGHPYALSGKKAN